MLIIILASKTKIKYPSDYVNLNFICQQLYEVLKLKWSVQAIIWILELKWSVQVMKY
jgi:hypothetical protein